MGEAFSIIKQRKEDITMDAVNMRTIRGDGTDELGRSTKFRETLLNLGIKWKNCPTNTHQQHCVAE